MYITEKPDKQLVHVFSGFFLTELDEWVHFMSEKEGFQDR